MSCLAWMRRRRWRWTWTLCSRPITRPSGTPRSPPRSNALPWLPRCSTPSRWLALDALSEEASRRLMRVDLALGDASAALQVYATLRARLAQELQVKPSAETVALVDQMRAGAAASQGSSPARRAAVESRPPSELVAPLVGRAAAFRQLVG